MKPLTPAIPHAIIMMGIPGSGKSTFAERFAETFQAPIINMPTLMRESGLPSAKANLIAKSLLKEIIKTKRTFIFEGNTHTQDLRADLIRDLTKKGYKTLLVWVQTDTTESLRRALKPHPKGSSMTNEEFDAAIDAFEPPQKKEKFIVISGKHTFGTQLKIVLKQLALAQPRPAIGPPAPRASASTPPPRTVGRR